MLHRKQGHNHITCITNDNERRQNSHKPRCLIGLHRLLVSTHTHKSARDENCKNNSKLVEQKTGKLVESRVSPLRPCLRWAGAAIRQQDDDRWFGVGGIPPKPVAVNATHLLRQQVALIQH